MNPPIILRNAVRCKKCGDTIKSEHAHDFVFCGCESVGCDGGHAYLRRIGNYSDYDDLSEITSEDEEDYFELARTKITWVVEGRTEMNLYAIFQ